VSASFGVSQRTLVGAAPASLLGPVKGGRSTWGALLKGFGLEAKDVDALVRQSVAR
jgi:hypothetical protein